MTRHLVIGASGQVGEHLLACLETRGERVFGTCYQHTEADLYPLDIRNAQAVDELLRQLRPDVVYLPAALTNVDYCEIHPDLTYETNVLGACNVVCMANGIDAKLVYFSSDYVFDGINGPYSEGDPANPICEYGRHKLLSEHYIALHARHYLIVRTTVVYGWESQRKNFVVRLADRLRKGERVQVPVDQVGSPTYAPNLAEAVAELIDLDVQGLFHVVGPQLATRYDFAVAAARAFGLDSDLLVPISTSELNQAAARPLRAGMTVGKAQALLKARLIDCVEGLSAMASEQGKRGEDDC